MMIRNLVQVIKSEYVLVTKEECVMLPAGGKL